MERKFMGSILRGFIRGHPSLRDRYVITDGRTGAVAARLLTKDQEPWHTKPMLEVAWSHKEYPGRMTLIDPQNMAGRTFKGFDLWPGVFKSATRWARRIMYRGMWEADYIASIAAVCRKFLAPDFTIKQENTSHFVYEGGDFRGKIFVLQGTFKLRMYSQWPQWPDGSEGVKYFHPSFETFVYGPDLPKWIKIGIDRVFVRAFWRQ